MPEPAGGTVIQRGLTLRALPPGDIGVRGEPGEDAFEVKLAVFASICLTCASSVMICFSS